MFVYNNTSLFVPSIKEILSLLVKFEIEIIIVGSSVANYYGLYESSKDIDLLLYNSKKNKEKLYLLLKNFFNIKNINDILELDIFTLYCKNNQKIDLISNTISLECNCWGRLDDYTSLLNRSNKIKFYDLDINILSLKDYISCLSFVIKCWEKQKHELYMIDKIKKYKNILQKYEKNKNCLNKHNLYNTI